MDNKQIDEIFKKHHLEAIEKFNKPALEKLNSLKSNNSFEKEEVIASLFLLAMETATSISISTTKECLKEILQNTSQNS